jgi:hypothetical protein
LALYFVLASGALYFAFSHWTYDDPFITYRYAENLAQGLGFVYNLGDRVLSTTTPLFTLFLASLYRVWPDLLSIALLTSAMGTALGAVFLWGLASTWNSRVVGWVALLLYPTATELLVAFSSETPLYLAFCLGAIYFYARQRYLLSAAFASLAALARPDGALVAFLLAVDYLLRGIRPIPWRAALLYIVVVSSWVLFAWVYFGSPLPVTLVAKQSQATMAISQRFAVRFVKVVRDHATHWEYWVETILAVFGFGTLLGWGRRWAPVLAWPLIYFAVYSLLGVTGYHWYYSPLVPGFVVAVGLGVEGLVRWIGRQKAGEIDNIRSPAWISSLISVLLASVLLLPLFIAQLDNVMRLRQLSDRRYAIYRAAGEWLALNTQPQDSVGALEVGIIGFYSRRHMVDFAGLIQPDIARQLTLQTTYEDAALYAVERYRPRYLVLHDGDFTRLEAGYVKETCQPVWRLEGEYFSYPKDLVIYSCP